MNIVYMGTPGFAVPPLKRLLASSHRVAAVVTQPDKPVGRGRKLQPPPVKEAALEHNLIVLQPEKLRKTAFDRVLSVYAPDAIVVAAYGKILPPEILALPRYGCINIHASLLPKYRGAGPIQRAIINGETRTGVTIMLMDEGLDTGPIIASEEIEILPDDDAISVANMLSVIGAELLVKVLDRIEETGRVECSPQDHSQATYAPMLTKADGLLDWSLGTDQIICRIMGLKPWPSAFSYLSGKPWKFLKGEPYSDPLAPDIAKAQGLTDPGKVTGTVKGRGFVVKTGDGHLLVTEVQPQGKRVMSGADAVNGKLVTTGQVFVSDPAFLEGEPDE
ncbi:MAG: methionyl-tRNA formyltransferase [Candidatus Sumerlaeaceae bacterium]|nr:methionyl-tRNA formyltransferase [Candidatus Sumerlaeaceae bacterium]